MRTALAAASLAALAACGPTTWHSTCGPPVVQDFCVDVGSPPDAGPPNCPGKLGDACTSAGATCLSGTGCSGSVFLKCDTAEPITCPVSRARFKREIAYVGDAQLKAYRDELMTLPLAT